MFYTQHKANKLYLNVNTNLSLDHGILNIICIKTIHCMNEKAYIYIFIVDLRMLSVL